MPTHTDIVSDLHPQPLYQKVKNYILEHIRDGRWLACNRIPSENELVQKLDVSRMTVNRALRELTAQGYLTRIQGVGTFVAEEKPQCAFLEIISIAEEIRRRGGVHTSYVHLLQAEKATQELAALMHMPESASVFHAILVHYDRQVPVQLADRYVNPQIAPRFLEQDFTSITPNEYLINVAPITQVDHVIEATLPDRKTKNLLALEDPAPCLVLHRTTWSGEHVATNSRFVYPGSRYRLGGRFKPDSISHRLVT
ncbi:MAG: histidine utilization repressor [Desulfobacteraceae bacterium]|nr:histidine utilization repressor [Desulfobacteraceae bacterium]